jgi:hypothetical protein
MVTKKVREARKLRKLNQEYYDSHNVEPTTLADGTVVRSRLEALWIAEFENCESLTCFECVQVPLWIEGPHGRFLSNYAPDLSISLADGSTVYVELKPNHELAMADDRPKRALELNPRYRFVIVGGYPYSKRGVTVRMLTGTKEEVHEKVPVCDVLKFLECPCKEE